MRILKKIFGKAENPAEHDQEASVLEKKLGSEKESVTVFEEIPIKSEQLEPVFIPFENDTDWAGSDTVQAKAVRKALTEYVEAYLFSNDELNQAQKCITQGKLNNEKSKTIAEKLSSTIGRDYELCNDMVRTVDTLLEINMQIDLMIKNGYTQYKVVCHLDKKTCTRCSKHDLNVYDLADGPKPPFHKNCRCTIIPLISDSVDSTRPAKNSEGKSIKVPSTMTYAQWKEIYWPDVAPVLKSVESGRPERKPVSDGIDWGLPNTKQADAVNGALFKYEDVNKYADDELMKAKDIIIQGIMDGWPYKYIATKLSESTKRDFDECHDLVCTVMAQASVDSTLKSLKECGQTKYQIFCVLDRRTCPFCGQYDGKIYNIEDGPKPPFHKNCRCIVGIVMPTGPDIKRGARDENGQWIHVPNTMTWTEWRQKYAFTTASSDPNHESHDNCVL